VPIIQFKGKTAVESYHRVVPHHTLEIDAKLSLAKKPSLDGNLIIEGDNLIALKSLLPTHAGKIKCIYIDPPYNTGNEGWIYNDNLTQPQFKEWIGNTVGKEGEDATRHDKWCCMMYPRLQLLKELLSDDGAIFVSIDDNEVHHLRMLMDEVFGEENFVAQFTWKSRVSEDTRAITGVSTDHEYVVCYCKAGSVRLQGVEKEGFFSNPDNDSRGPWRSADMTGLATKEQRPNLHYDLIDPTTGNKYGCPPKGWRYERSRMAILIAEKRILWPSEKTGRPRLKLFEREILSHFKNISSVILSPNTRNGTKEVNQLLGDGVFDFPKPVGLIAQLVSQLADQDDYVLDSTSGSGTTAHAVLELNKEDGGNRKFILVQQPFDTKENEKEKFNICEKITAERVRRVSKGYSYKTQAGKTEKVEGLGGEFAYVRVGEKLMGEYRDLGTKLPAFEEVARYVYFTETSQNFDAAGVDQATGKIGEWKGTSYYLLYSPNRKEDRALDVEFLKNLKDKNPRKVIYCEKIWVHREDLSKFGDIRPMLVPFNLK
jgi:adenine-specific DNA-methyltransferase